MSLRLLQEYRSDDEPEDAEEDTAEAVPAKVSSDASGPGASVEGTIPNAFDNCRDGDSSDDESADDSSESDSDADKEWGTATGPDDSDSDVNAVKIVPDPKKINIKAKGELGLEDLPPIEDLKISVPERECEAIGTVLNIVDKLVIVESFPDKPSLDLDTILFLDGGKSALGQIFDVFGEVTKPFYCVRFNSKNHIKEKGITYGMPVYYAPQTNHTHYVFISELMRSKGSDASWKDDVEPPAQFVEYSDDEEERRAKRLMKNNKRDGGGAAAAAAPVGADDSSNSARNVHRPTEYEERMNRKNIMKTAEYNRNSQNQRHRLNGFNPFGRRSNSNSRVNSEPASEIRWPSTSFRFRNPTSRHPNPTPRNWGWSVQPAPMPSMFNVPPFMRPPRFAVASGDWGAHQMAFAPFVPPDAVPPPPPPSCSVYPSSTAPPGT